MPIEPIMAGPAYGSATFGSLTRARCAPGELDLLAGCPPCQGFSSMRTLNGPRPARDRRNALVMQIARFADEFRPRAVMMENVPALATDYRSARLRRELRSLGYQTVDDTLDVAGYGVPQRRRRYILVALRDGAPDLPRPESRVRTVRDLIGDLPDAGASGDPLHDHGEARSADIEDIIRLIPHDGGSRSALPAHRQLACHQEFDGFSDVYGRMAWDRPAPTITGVA
jgi:DNA (cytosine-5)-methyltransferase 1